VKGVKKYASNEAFIVNRDLKKEYENRSYATQAQQQAAAAAKSHCGGTLGETFSGEDNSQNEVRVYRETTEVRVTYAQPRVKQELTVLSSTLLEERTEEHSGYHPKRELEGLLGKIDETKKEILLSTIPTHTAFEVNKRDYQIAWSKPNESAEVARTHAE
jgi:hypothetical protein